MLERVHLFTTQYLVHATLKVVHAATNSLDILVIKCFLCGKIPFGNKAKTLSYYVLKDLAKTQSEPLE